MSIQWACFANKPQLHLYLSQAGKPGKYLRDKDQGRVWRFARTRLAADLPRRRQGGFPSRIPKSKEKRSDLSIRAKSDRFFRFNAPADTNISPKCQEHFYPASTFCGFRPGQNQGKYAVQPLFLQLRMDLQTAVKPRLMKRFPSVSSRDSIIPRWHGTGRSRPDLSCRSCPARRSSRSFPW